MPRPDHTDPCIDYHLLVGFDSEHPMYRHARQVYLWGLEQRICMNGFSKEIAEAARAHDRVYHHRTEVTMERLKGLYDLGQSHFGKLMFLVSSSVGGTRKLCRDAQTALMQTNPYRRIEAIVVEE